MRTASKSLSHDWVGASPKKWAGAVNPLPADMPVGVATITFSGISAGSEIHIYLPDGTEVAGTESCTENQSLSWPVFSPGNPNNAVSVTIIKRGLRWQKFNYQSVIGSASIPIFPQPDLGYSNPA